MNEWLTINIPASCKGSWPCAVRAAAKAVGGPAAEKALDQSGNLERGAKVLIDQAYDFVCQHRILGCRDKEFFTGPEQGEGISGKTIALHISLDENGAPSEFTNAACTITAAQPAPASAPVVPASQPTASEQPKTSTATVAPAATEPANSGKTIQADQTAPKAKTPKVNGSKNGGVKKNTFTTDPEGKN